MFVWTTQNRALWARLEAFDLNESGASLSFEARLARDNNWSLEFAARVIREYKRFVFLACAANHAVTPSEEVDQAWHLHLCYTRSYWDDLCGEILGKPLHHGPTRGGAQEGAKFEDWYERTLRSYREVFAQEPPREIWPPAKERFVDAPHFRRVNLRRHWILPKPQFQRGNWKLAPALWAMLVVAGCGASTNDSTRNWNVFAWSGDAFLLLFWTLCALLIPFSLWKQNALLAPDDQNFPTQPLDAYALARLANAGTLPVDAALAALQFDGFLEISERGGIQRLHSNAPDHPFEREVWTRIGTSNRLDHVRSMLSEAPQIFDALLQGHGLIPTRETRRRARAWPIAVGWALLAFGTMKLLVASRFDGFALALGISVVALLIFAIYQACSESARLTGRGKRFLQKMRVDEKRAVSPETWTSHQVARRVALLGYVELDAFGLADVRRALMPARRVANSASCNSSDSGCGGYYGASSSDSSCDTGSSDCGGGSSGCGGGGD